MIRSHHFSAVLTTTPAIATLSAADLLALLHDAVQQAELTAVGEVAVNFLPQGASVVLVLEESHVALHLWPEYHKVSIDIHVCDYSQDNRPKAEALAGHLSQKMSGEYDRVVWRYVSVAG